MQNCQTRLNNLGKHFRTDILSKVKLFIISELLIVVFIFISPLQQISREPRDGPEVGEREDLEIWEVWSDPITSQSRPRLSVRGGVQEPGGEAAVSLQLHEVPSPEEQEEHGQVRPAHLAEIFPPLLPALLARLPGLAGLRLHGVRGAGGLPAEQVQSLLLSLQCCHLHGDFRGGLQVSPGSLGLCIVRGDISHLVSRQQ